MLRFICALILSALFFGTGGCSKGHSPTSRMDVEVRQAPANDSEWLVTWRLSSPVRGLRFVRQKEAFRSRSWTPVTPGTAIQMIAGEEYLVAESPVQELQVRFRSQPIEVLNDYSFLMPFSDGGAILYGGHLMAEPFSCARAECPGSHHLNLNVTETTTTLIPRNGHRVIVGDQTFSPAALVTGAFEEMAYFGDKSVVDFSSYGAVLDPALPTWIRDDLRTQLPRLLTLFEEKLGFGLTEKPILYFPYSLESYEKIDRSAGGVKLREMQLSIQGGAWKKRTSRRREAFLRLLAHEAFHLWNANRFQSIESDGGAWLHEGSAEALANRALLDLRLIPRSRYVELQSEALNLCIVGRDMVSGPGANSSRRNLRAHYDCGNAMHVLLLAAGRELSVYELWGAIFRAAKDKTYTPTDFFEAAQVTGDASLVQRLTDFANGTAGLSDHFFIDGFRSVGVSVTTLVGDFPEWYRNLISQRAIEMLIDRDCQGQGYYSINERAIELIGNNTCQNLRTNLRVRSVEDFRLIEQGVEAYDHLRRLCSSAPRSEVVFRHDTGFVSLPCVEMPERPRFLWLDSHQVRSRILPFDAH